MTSPPAVILAIKNWSFGFPAVIAADFAEGFRNKGVAVHHAPLANRGEFHRRVAERHDILFTVLMNFTHESARLPWGGRVLTWQQDNPYVMMDRVVSRYPDQHWLCADRDGVERAAFYFGSRHPAHHVPHWASRFDWHPQTDAFPETRADWERQRPFDLLFVGSIDERQIDTTQKEIDGLPAPVRAFARALQDGIATRPDATVTEIALELEQSMGLSLSTANFNGFRMVLTKVDFLVRALNRVELFKRLKGLKITVVSNDASTIEKHAGPVQKIAPSDFLTGLVAMKQSRLMINNLPIYRYGATERLFNAQLRGAAVLGERNRFLEERFGDGKGLYLYDPNGLDGIRERIAGILADRDALFAVAATGHRLTLAHHTIDNRVASILELFGHQGAAA